MEASVRRRRNVLQGRARYHPLPLGRFVPYIELGAAPGYTDLKVCAQRTDLVFLLFAGAGASSIGLSVFFR